MLKRYKNGVGRQSDVDKLQIEIFNADKTLKSLQAQHFTTLAILTELSGINLHNAKLQIPDKAQSLTYLQTTLVRLQEDSSLLFKNRPEIDFFALKQEEAHLQKRLELSKSMPYIDAFFQGGYANPGLNILRSGFKEYYIVGLRLNWDISNLYSKRQQDEIITRNKLQINSQKQEFLFQARLQLIENTQNAQSLLSQLEESKKIIALQEKILSQSKSQLQNGIININDFISDINQLYLLKLEHNYQEIEALMQIFKIRQNLNEWETLYKDL